MSEPSTPATSNRAYKIAIWFEGEQQFDLLPFIFFVTSANCAQQKFQFYFPDPPDGLTYKVAEARQEKRLPVFKIDNNPVFYDVYVFITSDCMDDNLFFIEYGPLVHITTHGWQENFSPPSIFEYLFHSIMSGAMYALTTIHHHADFTMGCQFEYTRIKELDRVDIALGYICQEHREMIRSELGNTALVDVENLFKFSWLGKSEEQGTISFKMKDLFNYDLRKDSGFKKRFLERAQANIDGLWFDIAKELFKGLILIVVAFLLFKFGLRN